MNSLDGFSTAQNSNGITPEVAKLSTPQIILQSVFSARLRQASLLRQMLRQKIGHDLIGLFRFRQMRIVPERVRQRLEHHQLRLDARAVIRAMQQGRPAQQQIAPAGDEQCRRKSTLIRVQRRQDRIFQRRRRRVGATLVFVASSADRDARRIRSAQTARSNLPFH